MKRFDLIGIVEDWTGKGTDRTVVKVEHSDDQSRLPVVVLIPEKRVGDGIWMFDQFHNNEVRFPIDQLDQMLGYLEEIRQQYAKQEATS